MLPICGTEEAWTEDERRACMMESLGICDRLAAQGEFLDAPPLQSVKTAASVRVRDGRRLSTDGPFAETHEAPGGCHRILSEGRATALRIAAQRPGVRVGAVEVRPLFDLSGLRKSS
jgi:hypothetical protein